MTSLEGHTTVRNDFATYAAARWPALVAFLVDEGAERPAAEEQATAGLARVRPRWRDLRDDHDLDEQVLAVVTGSRDPGRGQRFLTSLEVERDPEELPQRDPPVAEIVARAHAARRRTTLRWGAVALALVLVAGVVWLVVQRAQRPPGVHDARNPLPIPWYSNGRLHLPAVVVERPQVTYVVAVRGGAVTEDTHGRITLVEDDGHTHDLGRTHPGARLAVDRDRTLVAWAGSLGDGPAMIVYDVVARKVVSSQPVPHTPSEPLAIDQGRVFMRVRHEAYAWSFAVGAPAMNRVVRTVLDAADGAAVNQATRDEVQVLRSYVNVLALRGRGADLSLDGRRLLTYRPGSGGQPLVYDAVSGSRLDVGVPESQHAVAAAFGPGDSLVFALRHDAGEHRADESRRLSESGPVLLVQCRPGMVPACETLTQLADDTAYPPVLAQ